MKIWFWRILAWGSLLGFIIALVLGHRWANNVALVVANMVLVSVMAGAFTVLYSIKCQAKTAKYVAERRKTDFFLDDEHHRFDACAFLDSLHAKNIHTSQSACGRYWFSITCSVGGFTLRLETTFYESEAESGHFVATSSCGVYDHGDPDSTQPFLVFRNNTDGKELIWCEMSSRFQVAVPQNIFQIWRGRAEHYATRPQEDPSAHKKSPA